MLVCWAFTSPQSSGKIICVYVYQYGDKIMSTYETLSHQLQVLSQERKKASSQGNKTIMAGIVVGFLTIVAIGIAYFFKMGGVNAIWCPISTAIIGGGLLAFGILTKTTAKKKMPSLDQQIANVEAKLKPLYVKRQTLLQSIQLGNFDSLSSFADCLVEDSSTALMPSMDTLTFRPQKQEICYLQVHRIKLQRLKTRTVTRKSGGGYRIGKFYVPVSKERVQLTEVETLDTGTLAITSFRVLFLGNAHKLTINFDKILELQAYKDGIAITKEGRQSADFFVPADGELLTSIIAGAGNRS